MNMGRLNSNMVDWLRGTMSEPAKAKIKATAGISGIGAVLVFFMTYIDNQQKQIDARVTTEIAAIKLYVDSKQEIVSTQLKAIHHTLEKIDERLFQLVKIKEK